MNYNRKTDRFGGHDYPGAYGNGFPQWEIDEIEMGARVALALDDPEQWWWEVYGLELSERMRKLM